MLGASASTWLLSGRRLPSHRPRGGHAHFADFGGEIVEPDGRDLPVRASSSRTAAASRRTPTLAHADRSSSRVYSRCRSLRSHVCTSWPFARAGGRRLEAGSGAAIGDALARHVPSRA
eukprot:4813885-Pleurochrysis_carterae.AAC.2